MSVTPPKILFQGIPNIPIFYQSATNTYYLCPDCLRPHETRYCSGRTQIYHLLCSQHQDAFTNTFFDGSDLIYFRTAVRNGTLFAADHSPSRPAASQSANPDLPSTSIVYAHDDEGGCIHSSTPQAIILTKSIARPLLKAKLGRLAQIRADFESIADRHTRPSHIELLAAMKVGYLGTAVYLRRCNGQFINGVGEVMTIEAAEFLRGTDSLMNDEPWKKEEHVSRKRGCASSTGAATESDRVLSEMSDSVETRSSDSEIGLEAKAMRKTEPKMALPVLEARERLVREGKVSEEDLIITCWAMNKETPTR